MMQKNTDVFSYLHQKIMAIVVGLYNTTPDFQVEKPKEEKFGDLACNVAMVLSKPLKKPPREIATAIIAELKKDPIIAEVNLAGAGFINFRLTVDYWQALLKSIHEAGDDYGKGDITTDEKLAMGKINVEFVSANPTGPLHVGHARGAVFGDVLARLLKFYGHDVIAEYYTNDAGVQIDNLARSLYFRYQQQAGAIDDNADIPEGCYPGDYLIPPAIEIFAKHGKEFLNKDEKNWLDFFRQFATTAMMAEIKNDLALLNVHHDNFVSEKNFVEKGLVNKVLKELEREGRIYEGVLEKPKGKTIEDWEPRPQKLFQSSIDGDDSDRPLQKSDGSFTYFANDIAYHLDKYQRGAVRMIDILGADHGGYVKRIQSATKAVSHGRAHLECIVAQVVRFMENGEPLKMSKRAGNFIMLRDVVEAVGADALRIYLLSRRPDSQMDFDYQEVLASKRENPVFYLHYSSARTHSLLRLIKEENIKADFSLEILKLLQHPLEIALIKQLAGFPDMIKKSAGLAEPHRLVFYLIDLASSFHQLWTAGKEDSSLRFLQTDNKEQTKARLALVAVFLQIMTIGGKIMQITWKEKLY